MTNEDVIDGNNPAIGRGIVLVDGRYIGNTPAVRYEWDGERGVLKVRCDNISDENMRFLFSRHREVKVTYRAQNPIGKDREFTFEKARILMLRHDFKSDDWLEILMNFEVGEVDFFTPKTGKTLEARP